MSTIFSDQDTITGILSVEDIFNPTRPGSYSDDYELVDFSVGEEVILSLFSSNFDPYLQLINGDTGDVITQDDDGGPFRNSRLSFIAEEGINYIVRVTSFNSDIVGNYTLLSGTPSVDLEVVSITAPEELVLGSNLNIEWTVINQGGDDTFLGGEYGWYDGIYLSTESELGIGTDVPLEYVIVRNSLPNGGSYTQTASVSVNANAIDLEQDWYLIINTNADHEYLAIDYEYPETNKDNNTLAVPIELTPSDVDLVISDASTPETFFTSETLSVSWTVTNQGGEEALGDWYDGVYLSYDQNVDPSDVELQRIGTDWDNLTPLPAGNSYEVTAEITIPNYRVSRQYLLFSTNTSGEQYETDLNNNTLAVPVELVGSDVDLVVSNAFAPETASTSDTLSVSWTVTNQGRGEALGDWYDEVYLSDDQNFDDSDTYLTSIWTGSDSFTPLPGGGSYEATAEITIPDDQLGSKYLLFSTNPFDSQYETELNNNTFAVPIELTAPDGDLFI